MKKFLALLLALVMAFSLVACGGDKTPADDQQGDNNGDSQYPESVSYTHLTLPTT